MPNYCVDNKLMITITAMYTNYYWHNGYTERKEIGKLGITQWAYFFEKISDLHLACKHQKTQRCIFKDIFSPILLDNN